MGKVQHSTDFYVKKGSSYASCTEDSPCGNLQTAHDKCSDYDNILVDENLDTLACIISVSKSITIKPKGATKVEAEVNKLDSSSIHVIFTVSSGAHCIIKDFKFVIGQGSKTPDIYTIRLNGGSSYLRLDNCEFQRKELDENEKDTPVEAYLIDSTYEGNLYLYNCLFTDLTYKYIFIYVNSFYCYNSTFKNIKSKEGRVILCYSCYTDIIDSTFENCSCKNSNGGALYISSVRRLRIGTYNNKTKFSGCKAEDSNFGIRGNDYYDAGYGGAIYINGMSYYVDAPSNISNVEFDKENENVADKKGNCMFINSYNNLIYIWTKENVPFMKDISSDNEDFLYCYSSDDDYKIYNLKDLYNGKYEDGPNKLYVADKGSNGKDCSSSENACYTISHASSIIHYHDLDITFSGNYSLNETNYISYKTKDGEAYLRNGNDDVWIIGRGGKFECQTDVTFDGLKFVIEELNDYIITSFSTVISNNYYFKVTLNSLIFLPRNKNVDFTTSTNYYYLYFDIIDVSMNNCYFKDLECNGSVVFLEGYSVKVSNCRFENCGSGSSLGGALRIVMKYSDCSEIKYDSESVCSVEGCEFKGCNAKNGGAVYLNINKDVETIRFKNNKFDNNSINTTAQAFGNDIIIESDNITKIVTKDNFPFLKDLKEDSKCAYGLDLCLGSSYINLANFVNGYKIVDKLFIGDKGDDENDCLDENDTCHSLIRLFNKYIFYNHNNTIVVVGNYFITNNSKIEYYANCTYSGFDDKANLIFGINLLTLHCTTVFNSITILRKDYYNGNYYIYSYAPLVEFSNVTFKNEVEGEYYHTSFIFVEYDLKVDNCKFESLNSQGCSTFSYKLNHNNVIFSNSSFNKCSAVGYGGGLWLGDKANVEVSTKVRINDCSFKDCSATVYGGGLFLVISYYSDYEVRNNSFSGCSGEGRNIYVRTFYDDYIDFSKMFPDFPDKTEIGDYRMRDRELIDVIKKSNKTDDVTYYIGEEGTSTTDCTSSEIDKLCKKYINCTRKIEYNILNVVIVGNTLDTYSGTLMCNITGENDKSNIVFNTSKGYSFEFSSSISKLNVILNTCLTVNPFNFLYGTFTVSSVKFKVDDKYIPNTAILVVKEDAQLSVSDCEFNNLTGNGVSVISTESNLTVDNCRFTNLYGRAEGLAIHAYLKTNKTLEIKGSEFTNCVNTDSKGGAVYIETEENSSVAITGNDDNSKSTTLKGCGSCCSIYHYHIIWDENNNNTGCLCSYSNGGAIYLNVHPHIFNITMDNVIFGGENEGDWNKGKCGYDMYICGSNLSYIVNKNNFTFLSKLSSDYEGIFYYGNLDGCSDDQYGTSLDDLRSSKSSSDDDKFPWWGILLIVLGVIIIVAVVVVIIIMFICKRKGKNSKISDSDEK